ncbi:MAG: glycosyltransferase family 4 protein [Cyclobacteriaceae bacterium]|nr:glycosyltransferase family 4 protein [Cyclobacteriaceae bacterium]
MQNKKILIITYYWPPSGGSGVQRWLKFVKYLTRMGWEPYVFTPENPSFIIKDESLEKDVPNSVEVIKLPIWEPYQLFFKILGLFGKKEIKQSDFIATEKKSFLQSISSWIRGNIFIPDARIFWVKPSVAFLTEFIQANQIEKIITTGPPHSIHLIGQRLKKRLSNVMWVADFRDPWSEWDLLDTLSLTSWARAKHRRLECEVLSQADQVITIAPYHVKRFELLGNRKVELITNGFDEEDFSSIQHFRNDRFTIRHIGIVDELRDPRPVMNSLKEMLLAKTILTDTIEIEFIGNVNSSFKLFVEQDDVLSKVTRFVNQVPHAKLLEIYGRTDLQLLVLAHTAIAPGNLPGKFFEYLASGNPILAIGPVDGDAAEVLKETNAGLIHEREDEAGLKSSLKIFYSNWEENKVSSERNINKYSRKELTEQLVKLLIQTI